VQYTYNSQGTLATVTNAAGGITTYAYDTSNNLVKTTDARGVVVMQNTYDGNGRVIQQVQADGGVLNFAYTLLNSLVPTSPVLQTVVTDALGNQTTYRFDPNQNLLNVTDPTGQVRVFNHSLQQNNVVTSITGGGTCPVCGTPGAGDLTYTFDSTGNLLTKTDGLGNTSTYTYDPVFSQVTSITDPLGNVTKYTYDAAGNKLSQTDPDGNTTTYAYNSFGQVVKTTDALGKTSNTTYDSFGNVSTAADALGNTLHFTRDAVSRLIQGVDGLGRTTSATYDQLDRRLTRTNPKGATVSFTYDAVGNQLSVTDESGNKTTFTYDPMSRPLTLTDPRSKTETGTYDFNGNLVISEKYQDGSTVTRSYDARGRLLEAVDSVGGTFDFVYDADGRRTSSSTQFGTTQFTYDAASRVTSTQVTGQSAVTYTYDAVGNLLTASQPTASATLAYDARNYLTSIVRPDGVSSQYTYDAAADLLSIAHSGGQGISLSLPYSYDPAINRTTFSTNFAQPAAVTNTFDPYNRLTQSGTTSYTYDNNGALISSTDGTGTTTYGWDSRHRLASIAAPSGQTTTFLYDFGVNLISQTDAGPTLNLTQTFVMDDLTNVAYINRNNGDNVSVLGGRKLDQDLAVTHSNGQVEYALADATNSTLDTVDQSGKLISSFSYEPFGRATTTSTYPFQYTGRLPVTAGLYNYRARYYSCNGRFISEDPLGFAGGSTLLYEYAANNPLIYTDPTGLFLGLSCADQCDIGNGLITIGCGLLFFTLATALAVPTAGTGSIAAGAAGIVVCGAATTAATIYCRHKCDPGPCGK
jgi:RHS repeat-associated protein